MIDKLLIKHFSVLYANNAYSVNGNMYYENHDFSQDQTYRKAGFNYEYEDGHWDYLQTFQCNGIDFF